MATVVPGKNPGEIVIPELGNKTIKLIEWSEGDHYDSVQQVAGAVTAGTSLEFFRDLASKNLQDTNLRTPRRIPSGTEFILQRVGVVLRQCVGASLVNVSDALKFAYAFSLTFKINDRLVSEGPLYTYQSGYGIAGSSTENNVSLFTTGVPSGAAAPSLLVQQALRGDDDLYATLDSKSNAWLSGGASAPTLTSTLGIVATLHLHGLKKKPQGQ